MKKLLKFSVVGIIILILGALVPNTVLGQGDYYATREEAVAHVPTHVIPRDCFVWKDGSDPELPWRVIPGESGEPGTGCAHWVAHELGLGIFPSPWHLYESGELEPPLPPETWQVCFDGYYIRVEDVIAGRTEVELSDAKVGDIWTTNDLSHTGIVRQVGENQVFVEHDSSAQGGVVKTWFSSGRCWRQEGGIDLIFAIDTTGSMWDDIAAVKASASLIVDEILENIPYTRVAVEDYKDFPVSPYGDPGDYPYRDVLSFSEDKSAIISAIQSLGATGGADWEESVYSALMHAIDATSLGGWRGEEFAPKIIIQMGDAPPHDPEPSTGYTLASVITAAINADPVRIYPIQIGGEIAYMEELAEGTGGEAFTAEDASDVVDVILEIIGEIGDTIPPAAITDLTTLNYTLESMTLAWTASGDDENEGKASAYDIRYSTEPITEENWDDAVPCEGEPIPQVAGSEETFVVTNLIPGETYYFAIKTSDDIPNLSELSNVAKGSTWKYMFEDCKRSTKLYINTNEKTFQFISPDKDYTVKKATFMCKFFSKIVILHKDDELKLITSSIDKRWDYCVALALDIETCKLYLLIDEYGFET